MKFNRKKFLLGSLAGIAGGVAGSFTKTQGKTLDDIPVIKEPPAVKPPLGVIKDYDKYKLSRSTFYLYPISSGATYFGGLWPKLNKPIVDELVIDKYLLDYFKDSPTKEIEGIIE